MKKWDRLRKVVAITCVIVLASMISLAVLRHNNSTSSANDEANSSSEQKEDKKEDNAKKPEEKKVEDKKPEETKAEEKKAEEPKAEEKKAEQPTAEPATKQPAADTYQYTTKPGDSYTALARDAISKYTTEKKITLTPNQALAAEVNLVNQANAPELDINQQVEISKSAVEQVVNDAQPKSVAATTTKEAPAESSEKSEDKKSSAAKKYTASAKAGDSYTSLARQMISKYAADKNLKLSSAQRVAAETFLTLDAGSPELEVGQEVKVISDSLKSAVEKSQALSEAQQANWSIYAVSAGL